MASYNRTILLGNVTRDIELKFTKNNTAVCEIGLAVNDRIKRGDEWVDEATFVDCTAFGRTAEIANEYLTKGSPLLIEGRLKLDQWQTDDGQKRSKLRVVIDKLQLLGTKGGNRSESQEGRTVDEYSQDGPPASAPARDDESIPF